MAYVNGRMPSKNQFPTVQIAGNCTAVAIGEFHFLTAAHCLTTKQANTSMFNDNTFFKVNYDCVKDAFDDCAAGSYYKAVAIYIHPHALEKLVSRRRRTLPFLPNHSDLAIIRTERSIEEPISKWGLPLREGMEIVVGGYGCTQPDAAAADFLRVAPKRIKDLKRRVLTWERRDSDGQAYSSMCDGDSGGPVFSLNSNGEWVVVGVNSETYRFITERDVASRLDSEREWIQSVLDGTVLPTSKQLVFE